MLKALLVTSKWLCVVLEAKDAPNSLNRILGQRILALVYFRICLRLYMRLLLPFHPLMCNPLVGIDLLKRDEQRWDLCLPSLSNNPSSVPLLLMCSTAEYIPSIEVCRHS